MAGETQMTVVGNLTADPELRYTQQGLPVASFTVASTPRTFDRQSNDWKDGEALFMRCSAWREVAEHIAASLTKGARVVVLGNLKQRSYQDREGNNRTSIELEVLEVGPSLRYATAQVTRASQGGGGQQQGGQQYGPPQGQPQQYGPPQGQPQQGPPQQYGPPQGAPPQQAPQQGPPQQYGPPQGQPAQPQPAQPQQGGNWQQGAPFNDETPF